MRTHVLLVIAVVFGCDEKSAPTGAAPPPAVGSVCDTRPGGPPRVPVGLPNRTAGWCVDPTTDVRSYGTGAPARLDQVCVELFNGECELYKSYGLEGVAMLAYAPTLASDVRINVVVSEFRSHAGAFGFLSRRVLGGEHPERATVKPLALSGQGALGTGVGYVQRGRRVVELTYISETETPREIEQRSKSMLAPLARAIAESLGGETQRPVEAERVALEGHDVLGVEMSPDGLLGVVGSGPFATAHFSGSAPEHRLVSATAPDEAAGKDLLRLVRGAGSSRKLKGRDVFVVRVRRADQSPETWFFRRRGGWLYGVGPGLRTRAAGVESPRTRQEQAERWQAFALERLGELMDH